MISSEDSSDLPSSLRIQWIDVGRGERLVLASRVMLLRFHVKLLLALILFMMLFGTSYLSRPSWSASVVIGVLRVCSRKDRLLSIFRPSFVTLLAVTPTNTFADLTKSCSLGLKPLTAVFIFLAPFAFFAVLSCFVFYILAICSYTAFASYLIITETSIIVAVPSWKYRWLIHLNLLVPRFAGFLTSPSERYTFHRYQDRLISRIETPTFTDGSCKILIDYKSGFHVMSETIVMDHFVSASSIRSALSKLDHQVANQDLESGTMDQDSQYQNSSHYSSSVPPHIADEMRASDFGASSSNKSRLD